jgi:Ca-activated chloride channel family protein
VDASPPYIRGRPKQDPKTLANTLLEFKKCAASGINLNIFMLGQDAYPVQFVHEVSKVNHGRAFYTTPNNLGQ